MKTLTLIDVYSSDMFIAFLYHMLGQRNTWENISHKAMPSYDDHVKFYASRPYKGWYAIREGDEHDSCAYIGSVYVSKWDEIGIFLLTGYKHKGYGKRVVSEMIPKKHRGVPTFYANISPNNSASLAFFANLGYTYIRTDRELSIHATDFDVKDKIIQHVYSTPNPYYCVLSD